MRHKLMEDLKDPRLMYLKAVLFLVAGCVAVFGVLLENPTLRTAVLMGIAIWSFCRLYYFMFYVMKSILIPITDLLASLRLSYT